jgi:hypothetical protein
MPRVQYPSPFVITADHYGSDLIYQDLTSSCNGSRTVFTVSEEYRENSLYIFFNGLLQRLEQEVTQDAANSQFSLSFTPTSNDTLVAIFQPKDLPLAPQ